jgi:Ca2+-transporting ATPase
VLLELLLHPIISVVFETDPPDPDLMTRPPRDPDRGLLGRESLRPLALGTTLATAVVAAYVIALRSWPVAEARAFAIVVLLLGQLALLLVSRGIRRPMTPVLRGIVAFYLLVVIGVAQVHPLARLLKLAAFPLAGWPVALGIAAVSTLWFPPIRAAQPRTR